MRHFLRQSLLIQLLSVYLLFVAIVLLGGVGVNAVVEQRLSRDVQASDQALAQEITLHSSIQLSDAQRSIVQLGGLTGKAGSLAAIQNLLSTYQAARSDAYQVYWLDPFGQVLLCLHCLATAQPEFSPLHVIQQAAQSGSHGVPVFEVGVAQETPPNPTLNPPSNLKELNAGVIIAYAVYTPPRSNRRIGFVAANISLRDLSIPLGNVVQAQHRQGRQKHSGGTGLGLTICKAFIEAHGGSIWAESNSLGTTISFSLPVAPTTPPAKDATVVDKTTGELSLQKEEGS